MNRKKFVFTLFLAKDVSNFRGLNNSNVEAIKKLYARAVINVRTVTEQKRGLISMESDHGLFLTADISGNNQIYCEIRR